MAEHQLSKGARFRQLVEACQHNLLTIRVIVNVRFGSIYYVSTRAWREEENVKVLLQRPRMFKQAARSKAAEEAVAPQASTCEPSLHWSAGHHASWASNRARTRHEPIPWT